MNFYTPGIFINLSCIQGNQIRLLAKVFYDSESGRQRTPRLHAHVWGLFFRRMPEPHMRITGIPNRHCPGSLLRPESHAAVHVFQYNRVLVKKIMTQMDSSVSLQRIQRILSIQMAIFCKSHPGRMAFMLKFQHIILKSQTFLQRNPKSGMPSNTEEHSSAVPIFHHILITRVVPSSE